MFTVLVALAVPHKHENIYSHTTIKPFLNYISLNYLVRHVVVIMALLGELKQTQMLLPVFLLRALKTLSCDLTEIRNRLYSSLG